MATNLLQLIQTKKFAPEELAAKTHEIYDAILRASKHLGGGNFTVIHRNDVVRLVNLGQPWSIGALVSKQIAPTRASTKAPPNHFKEIRGQSGVSTTSRVLRFLSV